MNLSDRLSAAAEAKKAMAEKFRTRAPENDPAFLERQAARRVIIDARNARNAEREAIRQAKLAQEAAERAAREAAERAAAEAKAAAERAEAEAREAARKAAAEKIGQIDELSRALFRDVALYAERRAGGKTRR